MNHFPGAAKGVKWLLESNLSCGIWTPNFWEQVWRRLILFSALAAMFQKFQICSINVLEEVLTKHLLIRNERGWDLIVVCFQNMLKLSQLEELFSKDFSQSWQICNLQRDGLFLFGAQMEYGSPRNFVFVKQDVLQSPKNGV